MNDLRHYIEIIVEAMNEDETEHFAALKQTGFYGKAAAGGIFVAQNTGRLLFALRSGTVEQPHTWGSFGGAINPGETPDQAMAREIQEEAGYNGQFKIVPLYVFKKGTFRYSNFLIRVPREFTPKLNWESADSRWTTLDDLPSPLHFGITALLNDAPSLATIKKYAWERKQG